MQLKKIWWKYKIVFIILNLKGNVSRETFTFEI